MGTAGSSELRSGSGPALPRHTHIVVVPKGMHKAKHGGLSILLRSFHQNLLGEIDSLLKLPQSLVQQVNAVLYPF